MKKPQLFTTLFFLLFCIQFSYAQKRVGINTANPEADLDVKGTGLFQRSSSGSAPQLELRDLGDGYARLKFSQEATATDNYWLFAGRALEGNDANSRFNLYYKGDNLTGNLLTATGEGKVGIGVTPSDRFHVSANSGENPFRIQINGSTKFRVLANGGAAIGLNNSGVSSNGLYVHGNTGLGVSNPSDKLEVAGNVNITGNINFDGTLTNNNMPFTSVSSIGELNDAKTGGNSVFLGLSSGLNDDGTGNKNVALGDYSLRENTSGFENVAIGNNASYNNNGNRNVVVGYQADYENTGGWNNTILGYKAGGGNSSHSKNGNVFIGSLAGYYETGDNKLYIHNNNTTTPLIYGNFTTAQEKIKINGDFEVDQNHKATIHDLRVPASATAGHVLTSDAAGNATWQAPTAGVDNDWTILSNNDLYTGQKVLLQATSVSNATLSVGGNSTQTAAVYGRNNSSGDYAIRGETWATNTSYAVAGVTMGSASSSSDAVGVLGSSTSGIGVMGTTSNQSGIAILGTTAGTVGLAGRFEGPVEVTGKLSIGTNPTNMAYMLALDGSAAKSSGGSTWAVVSDERLKDIEGNYDKGLAHINQLNTVVFKYKKENPFNLPSDSKEYGFVAQEVQKIYPEAVGKLDDEYLDFNFQPILVSMVNAFQELSKENENLKAKLAELEAKNDAQLKEKNQMLSQLTEQKEKHGELEARMERLEKLLDQ